MYNSVKYFTGVKVEELLACSGINHDFDLPPILDLQQGRYFGVEPIDPFLRKGSAYFCYDGNSYNYHSFIPLTEPELITGSAGMHGISSAELIESAIGDPPYETGIGRLYVKGYALSYLDFFMKAGKFAHAKRADAFTIFNFKEPPNGQVSGFIRPLIRDPGLYVDQLELKF